MVAKFIIKLEEGCELKKSNFIVRNQEELHYAGPIGSDIRRMYSYPATVQVG